jgi:hypothetical protein
MKALSATAENSLLLRSSQQSLKPRCRKLYYLCALRTMTSRTNAVGYILCHLHGTVHIGDPNLCRGLVREPNLTHGIPGLIEKPRRIVRVLDGFFKLR